MAFTTPDGQRFDTRAEAVAHMNAQTNPAVAGAFGFSGSATDRGKVDPSQKFDTGDVLGEELVSTFTNRQDLARLLDAIDATEGRARGDITRDFDRALEEFGGLDASQQQATSQQALNQLALLSGLEVDGQTLSPEEVQARLEALPGFQFRRDQGRQAVERSAASRGLLESGAVLKELERFGQGLASESFGEEFGRLAQLASLTGDAGFRQAQARSELLTGRGTGLADITQAQGTQRAQALQDAARKTQFSQRFGQIPSGFGSTTFGSFQQGVVFKPKGTV